MAHIGLTGAGEKPARFADKRTGHRPLSNPATPSARQLPHCAHAGPIPLTLKCHAGRTRKMTLKRQGFAAHVIPGSVNRLLTVKRLAAVNRGHVR
jgi:hypothetical protein